MAHDLKRRVEKLEASGGSDFEKNIRLLAPKIGVSPDDLLRVVKPHESYLKKQVQNGGTITWEGFEVVYQLLNDAHVPDARP